MESVLGLFIGLLIVLNSIVFFRLKKREKHQSIILDQSNCFEMTIEKLDVPLMILDNRGIVIKQNEASIKQVGAIQNEEITCLPLLDIDTMLPPGNIFSDCLKDGLDKDYLNRFYLKPTFKDPICVDLKIRPFKSLRSHENFLILQIDDISEIQKRNEEMVYLSFHDALTGLYNRHFFEAELDRLDTERNMPLSLVMLDVNGLKLTNDAFGHEKGDALLKVVGNALKDTFRADDIIARWGGDEFVVVLPKLHQKEVDIILRRLSQKISEVHLEPLKVSVSYGCAQKSNKDESLKSVMKRAEDLMYRKKLTESMNMRFDTIQKIINDMNQEQREKTERVKKLSTELGQVLGLNTDDLKTLELISSFYDIGNFAIDEALFKKTGELSMGEKEELKRHSEIGYHLLKSVEVYARLSEAVLSHHERWDGFGYPRKIAGEDIPLTSRIISVVDAYEALISHRPYRSALKPEAALQIIVSERGKQFDPVVVDAFVHKVMMGKMS